MTGVNNNTGRGTQVNVTNVNVTINVNATDATDATNAVNNLANVGDNWSATGADHDHHLCFPGEIPSPTIDQSGPPTGRGLATGEEGWPEGAITTAGGYHIVPEGSTNWSIYSPGQKHGDQPPHTRVWGDPHVTERDGTRWDFTKDSDFVLGDGTRIFADTNYDPSKGNGQSVTTGLTVTNANDRIDVKNVNGRPTTGEVTHDGFQWRAAHVASGRSRDTFHLRGDKKDVHWVRERDGRMDGVVTGAKKINEGGHQIYEQNIDRNLVDARLAPEMRPRFGSDAWHNKAYGQLNDAQAKAWGQALGPWGAIPAYFGGADVANMHGSNVRARQLDWLFGGLPSYFGTGNQAFNGIRDLVALLRSGNEWSRQQRLAQTPNIFY